MSLQKTDISTKDLSYITDIFNWNLNSYNTCKHFKELLDKTQAVSLLEKAEKLHKNACKEMLKILK